MKHTSAIVLVLLMAVIGLAGCSEDDAATASLSSSGTGTSSSGPVVIGNVDRYFWGKWTRMDTGDVYHITD